MAERWNPTTAGQALDAVRTALADGGSLEIVGAGTRAGFGRPVAADVRLDLSGLSGVVDYQPEELVVTVRPGTRLAELEAVLAQHNQQLAFEPPDFGPLWGEPAQAGTIGGAVMTGRGGPRRLTAGGPRDHLLGVKGVNGFGEAFAAGGRVVKNVTGFDLTKLLAGSFGTLAVVTEMTLKVLPAPPQTQTLALRGLDEATAIAAMGKALGSPAAVSGAAHLPAEVAPDGEALTLLRLEGFAPSVSARAAHLTAYLREIGPVSLLDEASSLALWRGIGAAQLLSDGGDAVIWKLSLPATAAAQIGAALGGRRLYDWGGAGVWIALPPDEDAHAARVRRALAEAAGVDGHATLMRAPAQVRGAVAPFQPLSPTAAALTARVKAQFDPNGLFNPGRMYEGC